MARILLMAVVLSVVAPLCTPPGAGLSAEIRRTEYGIPHVTANDWKSLGYGFGYAYAQDNYCVVMREVVEASGRSAELLGEAEGSVEGDFLSRYLNGDKAEFRARFLPQLPRRDLDLAEGYTRGLNRYLAETGVADLPEGDLGCRGESWVRPIDEVDLMMFLRRQALAGSSNQAIFRRALLDVVEPWTAIGRISQTVPDSGSLDTAALARDVAAAADGLRPVDDGGSNALAVGGDLSRNGRGLLLGNPHQPWFGEGAWYQAHLTIPGEYDAAGAALHGFPFIGIGFNRDLAWTHTISYANRFSLYELTLNPDNPYQYFYDGALRDITPVEVTIDVLTDTGMEQRSYTFWETHYGPVINMKGVSEFLDGWPMLTGTLLVLRDANLETGLRGIGQWVSKAQATDIDGYIDAVSALGNPVFHELAVDRHGEAFYGELSAIPFITQDQLDNCVSGPIAPLLARETTNVVIALDGSTSACEWGIDPTAPPGTGLYGPARLPQLRTRDYVGNHNNSYWLSNPDQPLVGFPSVMGPLGPEGGQQFLRTRIGNLMVAERKAATDGLSPSPGFDLETIKAFMYRNRVHGAELVLDDVLSLCGSGSGLGSPGACAALRQWDRRVDLDSRGAQVFTEFWRVIRSRYNSRFQNVVVSDEFWQVDFDPSDPLNTPRGIDLTVEANRQLIIDALAEATTRLSDAGVALDAPWGQVQFLPRNGDRVPIHGGDGNMGVYGAISARLVDDGYLPRAGNSYIQAVTFDDKPCPIADVILVPSQSTNPASPHFADQTRLYTDKQWVRFPFCENEIKAAQIGPTLTITEPE